MKNLQFKDSHDIQICQVVYPLIDLNTKLLVHKNVVPDLIVLSKRGNLILFSYLNVEI